MNGSKVSSSSVAQMLQTHPAQTQMAGDKLAQAIAALNECANVCTICADACLSEEHVQHLRRCIRLNQDCADICRATVAVLARPSEADRNVLRSMLQSCQTICESCGSECEKHAQMHEHCRVCAESCRHCAQICSEMMQQF